MRMFVDTDTRGSRADVCYFYQTHSSLPQYLTIIDINETSARACTWSAGLHVEECQLLHALTREGIT